MQTVLKKKKERFKIYQANVQEYFSSVVQCGAQKNVMSLHEPPHVMNICVKKVSGLIGSFINFIRGCTISHTVLVPGSPGLFSLSGLL